MTFLAFPAAFATSNILAAAGASVATQAVAAHAVAVVVGSTLGSTALLVGASYALAKLNAPSMPRPSDGTIEFKQPLPVRFFTYGHCKTSGPVLFLEMSTEGDATGKRLLKIVAFGTREIAAFDAFYVDGTAWTIGAGVSGSDGTVNAWFEDGSDRGTAQLYLGKDSQAATWLLLTYYAAWTSNHRLRGIPYAVSQFESPPSAETFQSAFPNGESNFAMVGGVKVYDPRKDSSNGGSGSHRINDPLTWEFSENQRLCALDWIMWPEGYDNGFLAKGTPIASRTLANCRIDWASWVPQINLADENVALKAGGTEKRYRVATRVSYDEPRSRVLHRLMQAGDQQLYTTSDGLIGSRGGKWTNPTVTLDVEHMPEAFMTHGVPTMDRINEFELTAMLPEKDYTEFDLKEWSNTSDPDYAAGIIRRAPLDLTQVPSNSQAQRLAKIYMAKRNPKWSGQVRTNFRGLNAIGESAITLHFDELDVPAGNFNGPFWLNGPIAFVPDRTGLTFGVASADAASYSWNAATEEQPVPGET